MTVSWKKSVKERDFEVIVDSSMKFSEQCSGAVKSANSTLGIIRSLDTLKVERRILS